MLKTGEIIRQKRREAGLTQEELAEKAGISISYIGKIEIGLQEPGTKILLKLAKMLNIKPGELPVGVDGELLAEINMLADQMGEYNKKFNDLHPRMKALLLDIAPTIEKYL